MLGGMSERKFARLLADGTIPEPLELGPRSPRWTHDDFKSIVEKLTRRPRLEQPASLAEGRARRAARLAETAT